MRKKVLLEEVKKRMLNFNDDDEEEGGSESAFDTMRNKTLKALCREYGLHVSGNRSILLDRLCKHSESLKNDSEVSDSAEEDDIAVDEAIAQPVYIAMLLLKRRKKPCTNIVCSSHYTP